MAPRRPPKGDLARAFFCAEAVNHGSNKEVEEFLVKTEKEHPFVRFDKVHVSLDRVEHDGPSAAKFLVAYAEDAIYVAFRGVQTSRVVQDNLQAGGSESETSTSAGGTRLHKTVTKLAGRFLGSQVKLLEALFLEGLQKKKRVIFCGYRMGGAVAHKVVLHFWTEIAIEEGDIHVKDHPDTMISIAFEAPNFCNSTDAGKVNKNDKLKPHFFNCFVDDDHDIVSLPRRGESLPLSQDNGFSIGESLRLDVPTRGQHSHFSMVCVPGRIKAKEKFSNSFKSAVLAAESDVPKVSAARPPNHVLKVSSPAPQVTSATRSVSDYGIFITVKGYDLLFLHEPVKLDMVHPWETKTQTDTQLVIFEPPKKAKRDKGRSDNALSSVVVETAFGVTLGNIVLEDTMSGREPAAARSLLKRIVQTFFILATPPLRFSQPEAVLKDLDSIIQCEPDSKNKKLSTVLKAIAGKDGSREAHDLVEHLTLQPPKTKEAHLLKQRDEADLIHSHMAAMNEDVEKVIDFLTRSYNIQYEVKKRPALIAGCVVGGLLVGAGLVLLPIGGAVISVAGGAIAALSVGALSATVGGGAASIAAIRLGKGQFMVPNYKEMLKLAIHEASLWHGQGDLPKIPSRPDLDDSNLSKLGEAALEAILRKEVVCSAKPAVGCSGRCLEDRIEMIHEFETKDIKLYSKPLKGASLESKRNMVRRMNIVAKTIAMCDNEVKRTDFVGLVGAEDAGKSTFIQKAILKYGAHKSDSKDLPETGHQMHTKVATPYKIRDGLYLVDFPGSNGTEKYADAWRQFTSLPSSCILLLPFMDDIKQDQIDMYQMMKKDLDSKNVKVVFNKVDEKFTSRRRDTMTAEFFAGLRRKYVEKLEGCRSEDVHFVCIHPDIDERHIPKMRSAGVLDFEGLVGKVLGQLTESS